MTKQRKPESERILTGNFALMFMGNLIVVSIYYLLMTTMALYAITKHGTDGATGGLVASMFLAGSIVGRIISGRYAAWIGSRKLTLVALLMQIVSCGLYFADSLGIIFLILVRFVHGFSFGIANTTIPAMAIDDLPRDKIGEGTGYFMLSSSLGLGIGPLMSILLVMGINYRVLFAICTILAVVSIAAILMSSSGKDFVEQERPQRFAIGSVIDRSTVKLSIFMFFVAVAYSSLNSFATVFAAEQGWDAIGPFIFLTYSIVLIITRPITGRLLDRYGENSVLYPSIFCMACGVLMAACAVNQWMLLSCGAFMALGFGTCMSCGQAVATKMTDQPTSALAISTFFLLNDSGCGLGPVILGIVVNAGGYRTMYWVCVLIALAGLIYYFFAHGRKAGEKSIHQG